MTIEFKNDDLNILYLNGMTLEDLEAGVAFKRADGMSDEDIYNYYDNLINELRPVTKTSANDTARIEEYKNKGAITPFEYGKRNSIIYNNIKGVEAPIDKATRLIGDITKKADKYIPDTLPMLDVPNKIAGSIARNRVLHEKSDGLTQRDNKIDFAESLQNSLKSGEWLPYIGGFLSDDGIDAKRERELRRKISNGESVYQSDVDFLNYRINKAQEENVRKYTWGGQVANDFLPSLIRFGGEIATGQWVLGSLGLLSELKTGATVGEKAVHGLGNMLKTGAVNTALPFGWNDIFENYQGRMLDNETKMLTLTDKGQDIFSESYENQAVSFMKSLGQVFVMFSSEASGELLGLAGRGVGSVANKYVSTPISKYLASNKALVKFTDKVIPQLSKLYEKMNNLPIKGKSYEWLTSKVKFDGFLEELGEEVVEDVLNLTLGTTNEEKSLENYTKAIFKSPDEWAVLSGAILLQGGVLSVASHLIGSEMEANGASNEQIIETLKNLSENDKEQIVFDKIQSGELSLDELSINNKITNSIKDDIKTKALDNGVREDLSEKYSNLLTNILITRANDNDVDVEDLYNEGLPKIQAVDNETILKGYISNDDYYADVEEAYNQTVYYQPAGKFNNEIETNIQNNFGLSSEELQNNFKEDIKNILAENEISDEEFEIEDIRLYGSYTKGENKNTSDIDVIVQYSGTMKEDTAFNLLHDTELTITDKNGVERVVDINPINRESSGTIDEHIQYMSSLDNTKNYNSFEDFVKEFSKNIEETPKDYEINNLEDALKDLGITENSPRVVNTPTGAISIRVSSIEHIINGGDSTLHKPDKSRYKAINRMFAVLERPEIITSDENGKKKYIKLFKGNNKTKSQIAVVYNDANGDYVYTTIPVSKDEKYIINEINRDKIIYKKGQTGAINSSAANNIITDNSNNFNPDVKLNQPDFSDFEQQSVFDDINKIREAKNKGSYIPVKNLINLFKTADESTIVHELGHWYLTCLQEDAQKSEKAKEKLDAVRKFLKNDGSDFTVVEHEKFSRAFEAYVRSGYAKTNRLKRVFEDFKNALIKIYDDIKDMFWFDENGVEQHFTQEDLDRINPLFERLLSTENERIQATVFNRIAALNEEKEKIKAHQPDEIIELENIYNQNIQVQQQKQANKELSNKFIEQAETFANKESKETKNYKKRYKAVTVDILSKATGKSKQWITNSRNWEKLEDLIESSDVLSASDGFLSEWSEFYADTGLNDNSNESIGNEEKLLRQAFDRLTSNNFTPAEDEAFYQHYGEDLLKAEIWEKKFNYLYDKLKSVKGAEKEACLDALMKVFDDIPSLASAEFVDEAVNKLSDAVNYFDDKKQDIEKRISKTNMPLALQFKLYIVEKIGNQKVYNPEEHKYINITNIPRLNKIANKVSTLLEAQSAIREINNYLIEQIENKQRSLLHKEIQKQIKINSQGIKVGALRKGKFDWRTNTVFKELDALNKTSVEQIQKSLYSVAKVSSMEESEEREFVNENTNVTGNIEPRNEREKIKLAFMEYKSKKVGELNVQQTSKLLSDLLKLKFEGRRAKDEEEFYRNLETYKTKTNIAEIITKKLSNNKVAKYMARWIGGDTIFTSEGTLANWETLLSAITNKKTAEEYSLLFDEAQAEVYANKKMVELINIIADNYKLNRSQGFKRLWNKALDFNDTQLIINLFREYESPTNTYTVSVGSYNKHTNEISYSDLELNRSQIMMFYGWNQNKQLHERLVNMLGENQLEYIFNQLSVEDKSLMFKLMDFCDSMYEDTNEVFINITGLSLPKVENYLPSKAERVLSEIDMLHEGIQNSSVSNFSATKERKNCSKIKMKAVTPLEVLIPHINKTSRYVVLAEKMNFYKKIFIDATEVKDALVNAFKTTSVSNNLPINYNYIHYENDKAKQIKLDLNKDIKVDKIEPVEIDPFLPFTLSEKPSENKHKVIDILGLSNQEKHKVINANTGETVIIDFDTIDKSSSNVKRKSEIYNDFINILYNIETLFQTSQKIISHKSYKGNPDILIDRYANIVKIDNTEYILEFIVKNKEEIELYSVNTISNKNAVPTKRLPEQSSSTLGTANNSITYIQNLFKSKLVENYNVDYKESLKQAKNPKNKRKDKGKITGEKLYMMLVNQLSSSMFDNYAKSLCVAKSIFDTVSSNWISASVGGNLKVLISQLTSVINYSEDMPVTAWSNGLRKAVSQPKETIKFMLDNCDYLKARLAGNSQNEIISQITNELDKMRTLRNFATMNTRYGDVTAIIFGGKPYVDYLINVKGLSKEDAFKKFVENTLRSQQSGHNSATSLWQKKQAQNFLTRMVFAFNNTNLQYERKWVDAISQYSKKDISTKEFAKAFLIYKVFNPILFTSFVTNLTLLQLVRGLFGGDSDEVQSGFLDMLFAILLSNLKGYGMLGIVADSIARSFIAIKITGDYAFKPELPLVGDLYDMANRLFTKDEFELTDYADMITNVLDYATPVPMSRLETIAKGWADMLSGNIGTGLLETIGYGSYRASIGATGEAPARK